MKDPEIKEMIERKVERFKNKLNIKDLQLNVLLDITNAINSNLSVLEVLDKFESFVKDELKIEKLVLFTKYRKWRCLLEYGCVENEVDLVDVDRDLLELKDITSVTSSEVESLKTFDMIVPVYHGDKPLAYLMLGDVEEDAISVSAIIKHLNYLQILTNIVVSAIENKQLAEEALRQEREKAKLIEKQNEMLEIQVTERTKELRAEKDESERLLHNILPKEVAQELMLKGSTKPQTFEEVSILFTDFKDFTKTSSKISAELLVSELNDIFKNFDLIMEKYGIEKIKTIGDAYMAGCGLPNKYSLHALQCVKAANEMINYLDVRRQTAKIKWRMRVGIHSGPVVAGVVGTRKFTYDIWGDTVNTASRMESNGEPGKINISAKTHKLIKPYFECDYRGKLAAKGKGEIDMYFVAGEKGSKEFLKLKQWILKKLKDELPDHLIYHDVNHTLDVYNASITIAIREKITGKELDLLKVAALFHDSGFTATVKGHEEVGCELARKTLPKYGFDEKQIEQICDLIMSTKIPQSPKNLLQRIICDADLDYLGRDDFYSTGNKLFQELNATGMKLNEEAWNRLQIGFLDKHSYWTKTSKAIREPKKKYHVNKVRALVNSYD